MLGEDVTDHRSAEYLAKMWGLDWINKTPVIFVSLLFLFPSETSCRISFLTVGMS